MGTFAGYNGPMKICDEKKEEFSKAVLKLFYYGGMMHVRHVDMYETSIVLLEPVNCESEKNVDFYYNYFEDTSWENAGYIYDEQYIYSNKIGSDEFNDVISAAYCLYEIYGEGIGFTEVNGDLVNSAFCIGWINHILGTSFSLEKRSNLWKNAETYALRRLDYSTQLTVEDLMCMVPETECIGGTELADLLYIINGTESLLEEDIEQETYPADVLVCKKAIIDVLLKMGKDEGSKSILDLVSKSFQERKTEKNIEIKKLAAISLQLPARVIVYLLCEQLEKSFWEEWERLFENTYQDEKMKKYASPELEKIRKERWEKPIRPISTSEYLKQDRWFTFYNTPDELEGKPKYYLSDADRLYWWDGTKEVTIDEKTEEWLCKIKEEYISIYEALSDECDTQEFVKEFIKLLDDINVRYKRVHAFQDMFYEFVGSGNKKEYRAAIKLLYKLYKENAKSGQIIEKLSCWDLGSKSVKCNKGRMNMKRYISLLANAKLRMNYLGF